MLPGRLTTWKGHDLLIEAMARARADACCVMVGDGTDARGFVETMLGHAAALDLAGRVHFVGRCDDMPAAYMLADVVVSASTRPEAFGRVAVEAQAMGVPVVATDHGGACETVLAGLTGWLVPPGDAAGMARAIDEALSLDAEERARRAAVARAHVEANFSLRAMCEGTLAVYREVLEGGPGG